MCFFVAENVENGGAKLRRFFHITDVSERKIFVNYPLSGNKVVYLHAEKFVFLL